MKEDIHIAVFCRALIVGEVKTRLIPHFGAQCAVAIYKQLVLRTLATVRATCDATQAQASIWVAGDPAHASITEWSRQFGFAAFAQCEGDLGEKMFDCLKKCSERATRVLLIGTDCPGFTVTTFARAAEALRSESQWVFVPAQDGGYVLVGSSAPQLKPFQGIAWSTSDVMAQTCRALEAQALTYALLPSERDIDTEADVEWAQASGLITIPLTSSGQSENTCGAK